MTRYETFVRERGEFIVSETYKLDEQNCAWNENIHELIIMRNNEVVMYLGTPEEYEQFANAFCGISRDKFIHNERARNEA